MYADFHGFLDRMVCLIAFHVVKNPNPIVKPKAMLDTLMSETPLLAIVVQVVKPGDSQCEPALVKKKKKPEERRETSVR